MKLRYVLGAIISLSMLASCDNASHQASVQQAEQSLKEAHSTFKTEIIRESFPSGKSPKAPPKGIYQLIRYPAEDGAMAAYLSPEPQDKEKKYPAVIYISGGYGGLGDEDFYWTKQPLNNEQTGRFFYQPDMVLMIPSFRGEDDNPGKYEMFYGEIRDIESARKYLAELPYVDKDRIYLVGHSTGATRALLASEYSDGFRAVFALGAIPDLALRLEHQMSVETPFDRNNSKELEVRSPRRYVASIQSPTFYFEGEEAYWDEFDEMEKVARNKQVPFFAHKVQGGDHFNIIAPVTYMIAQKILQDTGEKSNIQFTQADMLEIGKKLNDVKAQSR